MVATQDEEVFGVFDLVSQEQADGLEGLFASIYIIAQEEIVRFGREAAILKQAQKIIVLAVDVATNLSQTGSAQLPSMQASWEGTTLIGASSSSNIGWEMKISRAFVHKWRISASSNWTCFPGLLPLTSNRRSMTESRSTSFWSAMVRPPQAGLGR